MAKQRPNVNASVTATAIAAADGLQFDAADRITALLDQAKGRSADGKPTATAKTARQALLSPALTSKLPAVVLEKSIKPAYEKAIRQRERAETEYQVAVAVERALAARKELYEGARGVPRRRTTVDQQLEAEEWKFIRGLRERDVPISAMDLLTEYELDLVATLICDKQDDPRHRAAGGAWMTIVRSGALRVPAEGFTEAEREAILIATGKETESSRLALKALCDIAGRELSIPPRLAEFIMEHARLSTPDRPIYGFDRNVELAQRAKTQEDVASIMKLLGLDSSEIGRAVRLLHVPSVQRWGAYLERTVTQIEADDKAWAARIDLYREPARLALLARHEDQRRADRTSIGADENGVYDTREVLERLGEYDVDGPIENAFLRREIREGTYFSSREDERRRTIDTLAAEMAASPEVRARIAAMGIPLPSDAAAVADQPSDLLDTVVEENAAGLSADDLPKAVNTDYGLISEDALAQEYVFAEGTTVEDELILFDIAAEIMEDNAWKLPLFQATGDYGGQLPDEVAIKNVRESPMSSESGFRHFLDSAEIGGVKAGWETFRRISMRRIAVEQSHSFAWKRGKGR